MEQPLPPYGACLLGSFNLVKYLYLGDNYTEDFVRALGIDQKWYFDFDQFKNDIPYVVRAMDNVIDRTIYPLPQQEVEAKNKRRMGLGVTGVANAIETMGHPYGSPKFLSVLEEILRVLRDTAYRSSIELAIEKGPFPLFQEDLLKSEFSTTLPDDIREDIQKYGLRNSHLLSIAPTGTISFCADNISSGIEPVFSLTTERDVVWSDRKEKYLVTDYAFRNFGTKGKTSAKCSIDDHIKVLVLASRYVDSACSKTCNVGSGVSWDKFQEVYADAYKGGASGCTTYRAEGKRSGILKSKDEEPEEEEGTACYIDPDTGLRSCE